MPLPHDHHVAEDPRQRVLRLHLLEVRPHRPGPRGAAKQEVLPGHRVHQPPRSRRQRPSRSQDFFSFPSPITYLYRVFR